MTLRPVELVGCRTERERPGLGLSAVRRPARPADVAVFDALFDPHVALAAAGLGRLRPLRRLPDRRLPDHRLTLIDLDTYLRGPFTNTMGRIGRGAGGRAAGRRTLVWPPWDQGWWWWAWQSPGG